jgi:hypothetical protein
MGGQLDDGNFADVATRALSRRRLWGNDPNNGAPSISNGDAERKAGRAHARRWAEMLQ